MPPPAGVRAAACGADYLSMARYCSGTFSSLTTRSRSEDRPASRELVYSVSTITSHRAWSMTQRAVWPKGLSPGCSSGGSWASTEQPESASGPSASPCGSGSNPSRRARDRLSGPGAEDAPADKDGLGPTFLGDPHQFLVRIPAEHLGCSVQARAQPFQERFRVRQEPLGGLTRGAAAMPSSGRRPYPPALPGSRPPPSSRPRSSSPPVAFSGSLVLYCIII